MPETKAVSRVRDPRLDAVRGVAIVGVVLGHVIRGLMEPGLASAHAGIGLWNERVLYLIRLPLFVIISGLLMPSSVDRRGPKHYLWARTVDLMWVYLLWTLLQGAVEVLASSVKNVPTSWAEVATIWVPRAQLWYLPFLAIVSVLVALVRPWRGGWRLALGIIVGLVISILGWGHDGTTVATRGMSLTIFVMLGAAITRPRLFCWWDQMRSWWLLLVGVVSTGVATWLGLKTPAIMPTSDGLMDSGFLGVLLGLSGATLGVVGVSLLVVLLCRWAKWFEMTFAFLGRHAMAIYLGHITAMAAARTVLVKLGVSAVSVHIIVGTLVGTCASLLIVWVARWVPWLLAAPSALHPRSMSDDQR